MDFKKIKEELKDPKKKATTQLIIYIIFFILVFVLISFGKPNGVKDYKSYIDDKKDNDIKNDVLLENYSYVYEINDNESIINIKGSKDNDTFIYNGEEYYTLNKKTYKSFNEEADFYFDPNIYSYENIEKLIERSTFEEKVVHKDLTETISYKINAGDYIDQSIESCSSVLNIIVEKKEYIDKVFIDLSNCYNYKYTINIEYNSID